VFTGTTGYIRNVDAVELSAERIDNNNTDAIASDLALQLWACHATYSGGELTGHKVAELQIGQLMPGHFLAQIKANVRADYPASGDYAICLVIAEKSGDSYSRIHDYHNYSCRDVFVHPRFEGSIGYHFVNNEEVVVNAEFIQNPRDPDNISGTLLLELRALSEADISGNHDGTVLGGITLGTLPGGSSFQNTSHSLLATLPADGTYWLVLALKEWNGDGYSTRDECEFNYPVTFPLDFENTERDDLLHSVTTLTHGSEELVVSNTGDKADQRNIYATVEAFIRRFRDWTKTLSNK
jgi:hypothetical protein